MTFITSRNFALITLRDFIAFCLANGWETTRREDGNIILALVECCLRARASDPVGRMPESG